MSMPERSPRQTPVFDNAPKGNNGGMKAIINILVPVVITLILIFSFGAQLGLVKKANYNTDITNVVNDINKIKGDITDISKSITAINSTVGTVQQVSNKLNSLEQTINNLQSNLASYAKSTSLDNINSQISGIKSDISNLQSNVANIKPTDLTEINSKITNVTSALSLLSARVTTLETVPTTTTTTTSGIGAIPNVTMSITVTDEGAIQSNNSTISQVKLTLINGGTKDISDITLYVYVNFDEPIFTISSLTGVSATYGTWSIRDRQSDIIQLKGKISSLAKGQTRRIYLDLTTYDTGYRNGEVSCISVANSDLEVIDWNYTN